MNSRWEENISIASLGLCQNGLGAQIIVCTSVWAIYTYYTCARPDHATASPSEMEDTHKILINLSSCSTASSLRTSPVSIRSKCHIRRHSCIESVDSGLRNSVAHVRSIIDCSDISRERVNCAEANFLSIINVRLLRTLSSIIGKANVIRFHIP